MNAYVLRCRDTSASFPRRIIPCITELRERKKQEGKMREKRKGEKDGKWEIK